VTIADCVNVSPSSISFRIPSHNYLDRTATHAQLDFGSCRNHHDARMFLSVKIPDNVRSPIAVPITPRITSSPPRCRSRQLGIVHAQLHIHTRCHLSTCAWIRCPAESSRTLKHRTYRRTPEKSIVAEQSAATREKQHDRTNPHHWQVVVVKAFTFHASIGAT